MDPLPPPPEIKTNKELSVKPGDSFFDYCNGTWLQTHPIPVKGFSFTNCELSFFFVYLPISTLEYANPSKAHIQRRTPFTCREYLW